MWKVLMSDSRRKRAGTLVGDFGDRHRDSASAFGSFVGGSWCGNSVSVTEFPGRPFRVLVAALMGFASAAFAQEAETGITVPSTITGGFMKSDDAYFGYHGAVYPALRLNDHWYAYAAVDIYSTPFFYYPEYN